MANAGRGKRMVYRVKSSTTEDGKRVYSVLSCADDVEHRRHRKNPFDIKYVQAVLSTFETIGEINNHGSISRFEVEAASTNVHVRMELIKTMKENLGRTTSEAVKHYKGGWRKKDQKDGAKDVWEGRHESSDARTRYDLECERGSFYCRDIYKSYCKKFGNHFESSKGKCMKYGHLTLETGRESVLCEQGILLLDLHTAVHVLEIHARDNANLLRDENLCFNLDKEATETLEIFKRFEPMEASILETNLEGEADIRAFCKHIKTVAKDLNLDANLSDAEEEYQDVNLIPRADRQSSCILFSEKGSKNMFACRVESLVSSEYVLDRNHHFDDAFTLNAREQCKFMGEFMEKEMDNCRPCKYSGDEEFLNSSFGRRPFVGFEVKSNGFDHHCMPSVFEYSDFPEQNEKQKLSQGLGQGDNTYCINWEAKISEDAESIEEFFDDATESSTLEVNRNAVSKTEYNMFTQSSTMVETGDSTRSYLLEIEDSFQNCQVQENHPSGNFRICLNSKELVKFRHAKLNQSRKKVQWLVHDMEKLLDSTEHFDNNSNMECNQPFVFQRIVVGPDMFLASLLRPSVNLVDYCKQLEGSPLKIPGALQFSPTGGDYEDLDLAALDQDAIDGRSCCSKDTGEVIDDQNQRKLHIEDSVKHSCASRKLFHEACILGVNWDDITWSCEAIISKSGMKPEVSVPMDVDSLAGKDNMLHRIKPIADISACGSREPEECCVSKKHDIQTSHIKISENFVFAQMCDTDSCLIQEILPVNSGEGDMIMEDLTDHLNTYSEGCLEIKDLATDFGGQHTNHSKEAAGIHIASETIDNSKEHSVDQCDTLPVVQDIENLEGIYSTEVQIRNKDFFGMLQFSDSCNVTRMEKRIYGQDHCRQKQRKKFHLDDLIAEVVMAECQFHQQAMCHFDLAPLSSSLATSISSFYHKESMSSVNFEQLLKLKGMIDDDNGVITMQRYYMALLSLAHEQNVGTFKGPFVGGYQIHLQGFAGGSIKDIKISLDAAPRQ